MVGNTIFKYPITLLNKLSYIDRNREIIIIVAKVYIIIFAMQLAVSSCIIIMSSTGIFDSDIGWTCSIFVELFIWDCFSLPSKAFLLFQIMEL